MSRSERKRAGREGSEAGGANGARAETSRGSGRGERAGISARRSGYWGRFQMAGFIAAGIVIGVVGQMTFQAFTREVAVSTSTTSAMSPPAVAGTRTGANSSATLTQRTGPAKAWGDLEITPLILERPDDVFDKYKPAQGVRWLFPGYSTARLQELIESCQLPAAQKAALLDTNRWQLRRDGVDVSPDPQVVRELPDVAREKLYSILEASPENPQHYPFIYREDRFDDLFGHCELTPEHIALVRALSYRKHGHLYFSDGALFEKLSSSNETRCLFKALLRVPTMLVKLRVNAESDIDGLMKYWGAEGRSRELKPFLLSLAKMPGGSSINISYLLPPVPRLRLYTYPEPTNGVHLDCFWTSFNFFGERPGYRTADMNYAQQLLSHDYYRWDGEKQFGDLLILVQSDMAVHACTYIAEDIYYTKNGNDPNQPWVLMHMKDIMAHYSNGLPLDWKVYRLRTKPSGYASTGERAAPRL